MTAAVKTAVKVDAWVIRWRGWSLASSELTGRHAAVVAELLDTPPPWSWFDLTRLHPALGPLQVMSLIAAHTCIVDEVHGVAARRAVLEQVQGASLDDLLAAVELPE